MAKNLLDGAEVRATVEQMGSGTVAQCVRAGGGGVAALVMAADPSLTPEEVRAASLQFVRKVSGFTKPSAANQAIDKGIGVLRM